jgi:hypothetical protein
MIEKFGGCCRLCGAKEKLEFHYRENGSSKAKGGWQHLNFIINSMLEGKPIDLLCRKCHLKEHMKARVK